MGRGINKIIKSVTIHGIGVSIPTSSLLPQRPSMLGFQLASTGVHIKVSAKNVPIHQSTTTTPTIQVEIRKYR